MCYIADIICKDYSYEKINMVRVEGSRRGQCVYACSNYGSLDIKGHHACHRSDGTEGMFIIRKGRIIRADYRSDKKRIPQLYATGKIKKDDVIIIVNNDRMTPVKEKYLCELVSLNNKNRKEKKYYKNVRELFDMPGDWLGNMIVITCIGGF